MFRLIRLLVLIFLAFAAGTYLQQQNARDVCATENGDWRDNTCFIEK
ncbi:hypothetical protein AB3Y40_03285 [Yoonia sp. R2331]